MKIAILPKTVDFAGTSKVAQTLTYELNKMGHEAYLVYRQSDANNRLEYARNWLGADKLIEHLWVPGASGRKPPYTPQEETLSQVLRDMKPDVVSCHLSGYEEFPSKGIYPDAKWILTNIFGRVGHCSDKTIYISNFIKQMALKAGGKDGPVIYNPIAPFTMDKTLCRMELRKRFNLPPDSILLGRVGRADNFSDLSLRSMKIIESRHSNVYYLVVNPCDGWRKTADKLKLNRVIFLQPIISDEELSLFYGGLDVLAHCRVDGECSSVTIGEAMMAAIPVVTHWADSYQGQIEMVHAAKCGFFSTKDDPENYADHLTRLIDDVELRKELGTNGLNWNLEHAESSKVAQMYESVFNG
jgi:glycosyltransferase involved in cell wall biosynthesis